MQQPTSEEEIRTLHDLLRSDPHSYLDIVNSWIQDDPKNSTAYFDRHFAWMKIGEPRRALDDLNRSIELNPHVAAFLSRGEIYRHLQEYENALRDFNRAEAIDPGQWEKDIVVGLLFQAHAHAQLGNEAGALACCARLPEDFWTPGIAGAPRGNKTEVAEQLRRIAADVRHT